jgi:hypothetical protein
MFRKENEAMKNQRTKQLLLEEMEKLNHESHGNSKAKKQAVRYITNSVEVGNKIFCSIPIDQLRIDHDMYQRPLQRSFQHIMDNWDNDKCDPITVNYRNDGYFYVINGQHRTEAAKRRNIDSIVCDVFVGLTLKEEAELFAGQYDGNTKLSPVDSYKANLIRGEMVDTLVKGICDKYNVTVSRDKAPKVLGSLTTIRRIIKPSKSDDNPLAAAQENVKIVDWIFSIFEESKWGEYKDTYNADMIQCLWYIWRNNQDALLSCKTKLIDYFRNKSPKEIKALGNLKYPECGHGGGIYRVMMDIVNSNIENDEIANVEI